MSPRIDPIFDLRRAAGEGRAFVYVLPLRSEELLKLGFSRDPVVRLRSLHPRYFDFFDLERAFLVETDKVREARSLERELKRRVPEHRAQMPLEIRMQAGGETEWYRGAYPALRDAADDFVAQGWRVHLDARDWLRERLVARSPRLFEWTAQMFGQMQLARGPDEIAVGRALGTALRDELDALAALEIDIANAVPDDVGAWYAAARGTRPDAPA
jgi:hypothetical protein